MRSEIRAQQRAESRRRRLVVAGPVGLSLVVAAFLGLWSLGSPPRGSVFLSTVRPTQANGGSGYLFGDASTPTSTSVPTGTASAATWAPAVEATATAPASPPATSPRPVATPVPTTSTSPSPSTSTTKGKRPRPKGPPTTKS
ncbi:hypothetical protein N865_04340 [Intrasporangium oryzae NRRL B-24470]|uniref:Uncharacterized protein n=1 Tax=Intrasporangium oryzae NRRL B-24470 TaxID=1386089 RepID=W9GBZ0_9MICO|nr:hypothetical protein [Intrasporangium oryzae]EWT02747.1 hypothetical protein N865_04340 [Intrasporangium oryzae NRRL B-24470]